MKVGNINKKFSEVEMRCSTLLVIGLMIIAIFSSISSGVMVVEDKKAWCKKYKEFVKKETRSVPHTPIHINGNADFASQAASEGWQGDGTANNPYIIENYDINASTTHGIYIENTDVYFIIRNCIIHDGKGKYDGIFFYNVKNGKIDNVTSYNNWNGIYLERSPNNQITNCHVHNNSWTGIYVGWYTNSSQITNCDIHNNKEGINLWYTSDNHIIGNTFINNDITIWGDDLADYIHNITSNTVNGKPLYYYKNQRNVVIDNIPVGELILVNCTNFDITNINITNTEVGIQLAYSSNNTITNCNAYNNSRSGIYLYRSSNNQITNCSIYNNYGGLCLWFSSDNIIANCKVYNNFRYGLCLWSSSNNYVTNCNVYNNSREGVSFIGGSSNYIINCNVYNNSRYGIYLWMSSSNQITNCNIYNTSDTGIYVDQSSNTKIHYCNIYNNTDYGIYNNNSELMYQVNATYNWWGDASGPYHPITNPHGKGDRISSNVLYKPWLTEPWVNEISILTYMAIVIVLLFISALIKRKENNEEIITKI